MKIILTGLMFLLFINCSKKRDCENHFIISNCDLEIPVVTIDYSKSFDTIRNDIQKCFEEDLCERCSRVDFKIPFLFGSKQGYLKVMADFDFPFCDNCGIPIRLRHYYSIMINKYNQLLVNGRPMGIGSLKESIVNFYENVGNSEGNYPETFKDVNIKLVWDNEVKKELIENVLIEINNAHLDFVEQEVLSKGLDFCFLPKNKLEEFKIKYPLRIEFDLGKYELICKPPSREEMERLSKEFDAKDISMEIDL